jgi:acylphosphatase
MRQFEAIVRGRVQGVSFRHYTRIEAQRLGVKGWVANLRDGTVKVVAQGSDKELTPFVRFLKHGPRAARVDDVQISWIEPSEPFTRFSVRWLR